MLLVLLAAVVGCQTYPMSRPPDPGSARTPPAGIPAATSDILPCAASAPASAAATGTVAAANPESIETLSPPRKDDAPAGGCPLPLPGPGLQVLTLADLEQMALGNNPTLPQAGALVQQQEGLMVQAGLYPNPQAGYVRTDADQAGQSQTAGVFLGQEIITAGKLLLAVKAEKEDVQVRNWQLNAQQLRVLNDLRIRFCEVLGAQQAVQASKELVGLAEEGVSAAEKLLEAKQGTRPDVLQARMQLSLIRTSLQDAEYRHRSAWRHLTNIVGVPDLPPTPLAGRLEDGIPELDEKQSLQRLLTSSPLLKAQEAEIRAAEIEIKLARAQAVPNVSARW